jgi:hypothetical protein
VAPDQLKRRQTNVRLHAPITPGSSITERALAQEAKANMDVAFGPRERAEQANLGRETQRATDIGGWYDQYLAKVAEHSKNIRDIGTEAATAGKGLQAGITGLSQAGIQGIQNPAVADAAGRGAVAGDLSGVAGDAARVRQNLVGSFIAQQNATNAGMTSHADTLARDVAPGQKLQANMQQLGKIRAVEDDIKGTATDRGQQDFAFRAGRRSDEAKNILAQAIATGKSAIDEAKVKLDEKRVKVDETRATETTRHNKASEENAATQATAKREAAAAEKAGKASEPNQYGVPKDQWARWSTSHRTRWIADFKKKTGAGPKAPKPGTPQAEYEKKFFEKYGVKPATTESVNSAKSDIGKVKGWFKRLIEENGYTTQQAADILVQGQAKSQGSDAVPAFDALFVRVVMDLRKDGYISASTADRLHRAGHSVKTLGLSTGGKANVKPPNLNTGGNLGGFPK